MVSVLAIDLLFSNAPLPIEVALGGIFKVPNDVLLKNALLLIVNKLPPSATAGILEHSKKACVPIV
jgi:hypothetical protein